MRPEVLAGLDLSLTGLGMVAAPLSWDRQWEHFRFKSLGISLKKTATEREKTRRLIDLTRDMRTWLIWAGATKVIIEDLPRGRAHNIVQLAELRGVVRRELLEEVGLDVEFVQSSDTRKLLYGCTAPSGLSDLGRKKWLREPLIAAGARFEDFDQCDAFAAWNWKAHELGVPCFMHLVGDPDVIEAERKEAAKERARKRAQEKREKAKAA